MKKTKLIQKVVTAIAIIFMATILCGAGCSTIASDSGSVARSDGGTSGDGSGGASGGDSGGKYLPYVGSIIMKDGSFRTKDNIKDDEKDDAIAVVYKVNTASKKVWAVGKYSAAANWEKRADPRYITLYPSLETSVSGSAGAYTFSGYTDGSTGRSKAQISIYTDDEKYYPAWYFCDNYGMKYCRKTRFEFGWYFPSIAELFDIWKANKESNGEIEIALVKSGGNSFSGRRHWSSSTRSSSNDAYAYHLMFEDGVIGYKKLYENNEYISVRAVFQFTY